MTTSGWIIMILSLGSVIGLFGWCMYKLLTTPEETDHLHGFSGQTVDHEKNIPDIKS